jgi:hypothetical protein
MPEQPSPTKNLLNKTKDADGAGRASTSTAAGEQGGETSRARSEAADATRPPAAKVPVPVPGDKKKKATGEKKSYSKPKNVGSSSDPANEDNDRIKLKDVKKGMRRGWELYMRIHEMIGPKPWTNKHGKEGQMLELICRDVDGVSDPYPIPSTRRSCTKQDGVRVMCFDDDWVKAQAPRLWEGRVRVSAGCQESR